MTLKEIEKIIDEADVVYLKKPNYSRIDFLSTKGLEKESAKLLVNKDYVLTYYKLNKETGEMTLLAKVDHIDKEKKIIKKKLDEMTDKELDNLFKKNCKYNSRGCENCPLILQIKDGLISCIYGFREAKRTYDFFKDKEFEIEVEE